MAAAAETGCALRNHRSAFSADDSLWIVQRFFQSVSKLFWKKCGSVPDLCNRFHIASDDVIKVAGSEGRHRSGPDR